MGVAHSIRDIARETGLSTATISLALRGKGRMSEETRDRVKDAAKALGYQPHPLFSKAFSLARQPAAKRYRETLAFLIEWETETGPPHQKELYAGALEQASNMGYKLDSFIVSGKPGEQRRLGRILKARGIRGVIVAPLLANPYPRLHFDWQHFSPVEIGRTLYNPRNLHRVETAGYPMFIEALHLLKKVGYRRIGMAIEPRQNHHQNGIYYAAYLFSQLKLPASQRLPILATKGLWNERAFGSWLETNKPDAMVIHGVVAGEILEWLARMNLKVPQDISLFCVNVLQNQHLSGLRRDYTGVGRAAVEMVSLLMEGGELGLSGNPRSWQVDEFWQAGETLNRPISDHITGEGFLRQESRRTR